MNSWEDVTPVVTKVAKKYDTGLTTLLTKKTNTCVAILSAALKVEIHSWVT